MTDMVCWMLGCEFAIDVINAIGWMVVDLTINEKGG